MNRYSHNTKLHFTVLYFYAKQNTDSFGQEGFFKMFKQAKEIYLLYYCDLTIKLKGFLLLFPPPFFEAFKNEIVWDFETSSST